MDQLVPRPRHLARRDGAQRRGRRAARRARPTQGGGVTEPLLRVRDLKTYFVTEHGSGTARAVDGVSFEVYPGETLGLVGESGCGKTVTSLSILRLIPEPPGHIRPGSFIEFEGRNLLTLAPRELRAIRGNRIAMIFQEPMTSLNPVFTVGDQIAEAAIVHQGLSRRRARARAVEMLKLVGIPDPAERVDHYPHQMSGGMRQRVMIAMALVCHPKLLIADEPTTALDVTIQAQILELLDRLQRDLGMAVMLITHDLGVVAGTADRVVVMYAGEVVEQAATGELFARPLHPYTEGLMASVPRIDTRVSQVRGRLHSIPGQVPAATAWPAGCRFHPRCPYAWDRCRQEAPPPLDAGAGEPGAHTVRCWLLTEPQRRSARA
ncbi:MAG: peptide ABC transporter ATP-binding protein [Gemmatimonadetes bacterium]|nr:MAG: peptide ABC transporter ATP-binding protein [Gemmatimonadota bacterium]